MATIRDFWGRKSRKHLFLNLKIRAIFSGIENLVYTFRFGWHLYIKLYIITVMIEFRAKLNYRNLTMRAYADPEDHAPILMSNGDHNFVKWLGIIHESELPNIREKRAVKIRFESYRAGIGSDWIDIEKGRYMLGCQTSEGVYGVLKPALPWLV